MLRNIILMTQLMAISALSQPVPGGLAPEGIARLRAQYAALNGKTFRLNGDLKLGRVLDDSPEQVPIIRKQLLAILREAIVEVLSSPGASESQIVAAIRGVQGDFVFDRGGWWGTNTPFVHLYSMNGIPSLAAAFVIEEGGEGIPDSQTFLDFYVELNGRWKLQAVTGSEFRASTYFVSPIPAGLAGESWFLAWGFPIGNTGTTLAVRLYSFNGDEARVVWKRDGLVRGEVAVSGNSVTLDYDKDYRPQEIVERLHEVLHVTPNGLE